MTGVKYSVVRRHMKHTSAFTRCDSVADLPFKLTLPAGESLVGWYRNPPPWDDCVLVFSSDALYVAGTSSVDRISYAEIIGYERPTSKSDISGIRLLTRSGPRFVRIAGSSREQASRKDAFSFLMVVRGVIQGAPVISTEGEPR